MQGVLDRFEDYNKAVILIEEIKEELIVDKDTLPEGSEVNTYFNVEKRNDGEIIILQVDENATKNEEQKTSDLMSKLRAKSNGSKFKKK